MTSRSSGNITKAQKAGSAAIEDRYRQLTPKSKAFYEEAERFLVAGSVKPGGWHSPYPICIDRSEGAYLYDIDGRRYVDFTNSHSIPLFGHANPKVVQAMRSQLDKGLFSGGTSPTDIELARILVERVPSMDKVAFSNSGTEATMIALRVARAFMKRDKIAKMDGGYHGWHDTVMFNASTHAVAVSGQWGPGEKVSTAGVPKVLDSETVLLPFNDIEGCERIIREHKDDLACVITEPFLGGAVIPPRGSFLKDLRAVTKRYGVLLVFDEMISFGLGMGGGQGYYGVYPDITATGKIIGGGMPIGAFGGRADIMALTDPRKGRPAVMASGTFSGLPLAMVAGAASLKQMTPEVFAELHRKGDDFRKRVRAMLKRIEAPMSVSGVGQYSAIHTCPEEPQDWYAFFKSDVAARRLIGMGLVNRGFWMQGFRGDLTMATEETHIAAFIQALEESVRDAYSIGSAN